MWQPTIWQAANRVFDSCHSEATVWQTASGRVEACKRCYQSGKPGLGEGGPANGAIRLANRLGMVLPV
jgi:hypothetical protein